MKEEGGETQSVVRGICLAIAGLEDGERMFLVSKMTQTKEGAWPLETGNDLPLTTIKERVSQSQNHKTLNSATK